MIPDVLRARRLVEARLGRPPQDVLEAAVVLEAWAGVPAQRALDTARALMPVRPAPPPDADAAASRSRPAAASSSVSSSERSSRRWFESAAFIVTIAAIALWAAPLVTALGVHRVREALVVALPVTLGLQWALVCRHLGRRSGLTGLAPRRGALIVGAAASVFALTAALGSAGALAGLLIVTWTSGAVLIRRGWAGAYCAVVAAAVPAMAHGVSAPSVVAVVATVTAGLAWGALATVPVTGAAPAGRWSRTVGAGLTGTGVGVLLVADPTASWTGGAASALALLPSAIGGLWAGQHLWKLAGAFPRALAGVPACPRRGVVPARRGAGGRRSARIVLHASRGVRRGDGRGTVTGPFRAVRGSRRDAVAASLRGAALAPARALGGAARGLVEPLRGAALAPARALGGAALRLVAVTAVGTAALLVATPSLGAGPSVVGVLAGYGLIALATLLAGLVDALGRPELAAVGIGGGVAAAIAVRTVEAPFAGAVLLCGGAVAVLVLLPAALVLLTRPARTLATTLWIT